MLKNKNIICISSIDWDFVWQGHQEIMSTFAKNGNRILFIENTGARMPEIADASRIIKRIKNWFQGTRGIRKENDNLYIYSPLVLPFPYNRILTWINKRIILSVLEKWIKTMNFNNIIFWVFLPTPLTLRILDNLNYKVTIYYCIDNFRVSSSAAKKITKSEKELLKKADIVFVTSQELFNYCSGYNDKINLFPFAVNFEEFEKVRLSVNSIPAELKDIKKPIIGYIGGIHKWLDFNLIKEVTAKYSQYSFVFIGPLQTDVSSLKDLKNVYFIGKIDHKMVSSFINNFDACLIPYLVTDYTNNVYPTKLNEYLAMGKAVISTALPEVFNFNKENDHIILIGNTNEEFGSYVLKAVKDKNEKLAEKRISCAKKNSWVIRIEQMSGLIEEIIEAKSRQPINWNEKIIKIYRTARRKTLSISAVFLSFYLLLFYTPLVWFIAKPLNISQPPEKADCIVVFAGGVGESGQAGQGFEERVKYAVDLYKNGYAKNLVFSSGYMYIYKEPLMMKALAVSLGVPENAIILENESKSTYENVKFTLGLLNKYNYKKILLVSSPYHMRRSALVFNKISRGLVIRYTPIINSLFYAKEFKDAQGRKYLKRAKLSQIHAIIHEYFSLIYYWLKGYI